MQLKIVEFIKKHENWEEILTKEPYCLRISRKLGYVLITYILGKTDFSIQEKDMLLECRGLILREVDYEPVCIPFFKFFNHGEAFAADIDWESAKVLEKIDGSLIKIWSDSKDETKGFRISTNGAISASESNYELGEGASFEDLVIDAIESTVENFTEEELYQLDTVFRNNNTHMFELVSEYNRIVVDYGSEPQLYYLGSRNNETYLEYKEDILTKTFKTPKEYSLKSYKECLQFAEAIDHLDKEGFVIVDKNYNRIKIKTLSYIQKHYMLRATPKKAILILKNNEKEEYFSYCSKEMKQYVLDIESDIIQEVERVIKLYEELVKNNIYESKKDFAIAVKSLPEAYMLFKFYELKEVTLKEAYDIFLKQSIDKIINSIK